MIEFKSMASAHDGCSYYQAKTPIDFWCRRDLNPAGFEPRSLARRQETLPVELTGTHTKVIPY